MLTVLSYNRKIAEQKLIQDACSAQVAKRCNDQLRFIAVSSYDEIARVMEKDHVLDLIYYEIADEADIEQLKILRRWESDAMLVLLTSSRISPVRYLRPQIAPDQLVLYPISAEKLEESNQEVFELIFSKTDKSKEEDCFILKAKDSRMRIPYEKISYFEASNKKISLRVGNEAYDFYGSIDSIAGQVPDYFVQCHRAYLVNVKKIKKVCLADNRIELSSGAAVPVSRTYRKAVSQRIK